MRFRVRSWPSSAIVIDQVRVDERIRVVVLTGAGSTFCAGMDLKEAAAVADGCRGRANDDRDPAGVRRPAPVPAHAAQADDRRGQRRRARRWCGPDGGVRPGRRRRERADRLPGGQARPGGRRSSCTTCRARSATVAHASCCSDRRADLGRGRDGLGDGQSGDAGGELSGRGDPARARACCRAARRRSPRPSGCSMKRWAAARPARRRGGERGRPGLGRGARGHPRVRREAAARVGRACQ